MDEHTGPAACPRCGGTEWEYLDSTPPATWQPIDLQCEWLEWGPGYLTWIPSHKHKEGEPYPTMHELLHSVEVVKCSGCYVTWTTEAIDYAHDQLIAAERLRASHITDVLVEQLGIDRAAELMEEANRRWSAS